MTETTPRTPHRSAHPPRRRRRLAAALGLGLVALAGARPTQAAESKTLCVFDPSGASGDVFAKMKGYQADALLWGVNFTLKPYTDESVAASDFRNKVCDAVVLTGVTGREFNPKTYTLEAMGLFPSYQALGNAIRLLANPKAAPLSQHQGFETVGVLPAGAVYLYLRDRGNASLPKLSGRSIAAIGADPAARQMINRVGATATRADVSTFASLFNNGSVDVCYSPATAYKPMELHRGVGSDGGVVRFPIAQLTFQIYVRPDEFPADFGKSSRARVAQDFDAMLRIIERAEASVGAWIDVSADDAKRYTELLRDVRDQLKAQSVYDGAILKLGGA